MKKRVLSFVLALLLFVMVPAETAMAMPAVQAQSLITLMTEEVAETDEVVDETVVEETIVEEEVVEATEEPVEEPTEEEVVEATEEPVEEPTEEPTIEPTEVPEETVVPEVTPETEATVEPTAEVEATEEPTEEPVEEATEEPTAEATEEPSVTPSATPDKKDVQLAGRDLTAKVVGSNGIQYEGVAYLSLQTVNSLPDESAKAYVAMCDEVASWFEAGKEYKNIVIAVDEEGNLRLRASIPLSDLVSEEMQEQFFDGEPNEEVEENTVESFEETAVVENIEEVVEDNAVNEENEESVDESVEETVEEDIEEVTTEESTDEMEEQSVEKQEEIVVENEEVKRIISENMELATSYDIPEESVEIDVNDSLKTEEFDTLITDKSFFKNQLNSTEKSIYNVAKSSLADKGKNNFSYKKNSTGKYNFLSLDYFANAISAVVNTYPNRVNWMDYGTGLLDWEVWWYPRGYYHQYNIKVQKSKHYNKTLETNANKKVSALVKNAKTYAATNHPKNPVYGMVEYFDKWICENNYYNNAGTSNDETIRKSSTYFYCHSCYGILLKGYGVCQSYALAMSRLLDAAGIRNMYVLGHSGGEGHAWNYVQMPDGKWYLLDSTWNDAGNRSDKGDFLKAKDSSHTAEGFVYDTGKTFKYETLSTSNYTSTYEQSFVEKITLSKSTTNPVYLKPGAKHQLKVNLPNTNNYYFSKYAKAWKSDNTKVAKVDKNGKITAGKTTGKATITYTVAGQTKSCTVYVYKFSGLTFGDNNKTSYSQTWGNPSTTTFNSTITKTITVKQSNKQVSAYTIKNGVGLANPTVTSSNKKVAEATVSALNSNDTITLTVKPKKIGSTKITVKFGGKTATYKLTVKYQIDSNWFVFDEITKANNTVYTGKAIKPQVGLKDTAPTKIRKKLCTVSYKNNVNAGTATVTIKGTGNYTGTITKNFTIAQQDISKTAKFTSCTKAKTYNGKAQKASTVVKVGKKTLKAGKDYDVQYYYNKAWTTTAPTNKNVYSVRIVGKNNYKGVLAAPNAFEIKQIAIGKVTVSCAKTVKWKNGTPVTAPVKVKIGKNVLTKNADYVVTYYKVVGTTKTKVADNALKDKAKYEAVITPKGSNINWGTKTQIVKTFTIK